MANPRFVEIVKASWGGKCHDCGASLDDCFATDGRFWHNVKPRSKVRNLCDLCHQVRQDRKLPYVMPSGEPCTYCGFSLRCACPNREQGCNCGGQLEVAQHAPGWKPAKDQGYYFTYWLRCPACKSIFMLDQHKVYLKHGGNKL